ncbi:MAG: secretin N-terminal domain-containing protein [Planctomycetota bacterium]|nr:secretin N-terminal domain-containing protein [Planctomycetota bacterium]
MRRLGPSRFVQRQSLTQHGLALALAALAGLAAHSPSLARQAQQPPPGPAQSPTPEKPGEVIDPATGRPIVPPPAGPEGHPARRVRNQQAQQPQVQPAPDPAAALEERNRRVRDEAERARQQALEGLDPQIREIVNQGQQPPPEGAVEHLQGDGLISIDFGSETVDLLAFVNYVSLAIGKNILADPGIGQQQITFGAPLKIEKDQLLSLLSAVLEDRGFAVVEDPLIGYQVKPTANIPMVFGEGDGATTRVIRTGLVRPSALQQPLTNNLGQPIMALLRISYLDDISVIIATGTPRVLDSVQQMVDSIAREIAAQGLHPYQLINVEADFARSRIVTLNGKLGGAGGAIAAAPGSPGAAGGGGGLSNLENRLIVDAGNTLIFRGTEAEAAEVAELIELVDVVSPLIARRYNAGSLSMDVAMAGEREGLGPVEQSQGPAPQGGGFVGGRGNQPNQGLAAQSTEARTNTSGFSVDTEAGSILYFGTEQQHKRVAELVKSFTDQLQFTRTDIKMYKLHNADAESVAELIQALIEDDSQQQAGSSTLIPNSRTAGFRNQRAQTGPNAGDEALQAAALAGEAAPASGPVSAQPDIKVVADADRNQLLVKASARQQAQLEQIIRRLDERQPQVFIEAQIVSITTREDFEWTVETQINAGQFLLFSNFGLSTAGTPAAGQQAAQAVRNVATGNRGLTSALIKSDYVPFILNTLASETNARVESHPRILVNDNQQGEISSTREEPFSATTQGESSTITSQGGVASAGTTLSVTPRISQGGYISLEYSVELSSFVGNPSAGLQPPKQTENYDSQVTVPSDSTIVVGGFTLLSESESDSGIPILKDIPILGAAFKDYGTTRQRTTIFVFITPTIMTDPNFIDLRLASEGPMKRMEIEGTTPTLEPVAIPISPGEALRSRLVPTNEAPDGP